MGSHLHHLGASSRVAAIRRRSAYFPPLLRRYSPSRKERNGHGMERAPTTAEEFERVAEEIERVAEEKARQGFTSQTIEKAQDDGAGEVAIGDSRGESVKEKYSKEAVGKGSFHKISEE